MPNTKRLQENPHGKEKRLNFIKAQKKTNKNLNPQKKLSSAVVPEKKLVHSFFFNENLINNHQEMKLANQKIRLKKTFLNL